MSNPPKNAPAAVGAAAGAIEPVTHKIGDSLVTIPVPPARDEGRVSNATLCRHCTVPTDGSDVCSFCRTYTLPVEAGALLAEADQHLVDALTLALAEQFANARPSFPLDGYICQARAEGTRVFITATSYDAPRHRYTTREFACELREVV